MQRFATRAVESGRQLEIHHIPRLHNCEITLSNGVCIVSDRDVDLYDASLIGLRRRLDGRTARMCKKGAIDIFSREHESSVASMSQTLRQLVTLQQFHQGFFFQFEGKGQNLLTHPNA